MSNEPPNFDSIPTAVAQIVVAHGHRIFIGVADKDRSLLLSLTEDLTNAFTNALLGAKDSHDKARVAKSIEATKSMAKL